MFSRQLSAPQSSHGGQARRAGFCRSRLLTLRDARQQPLHNCQAERKKPVGVRPQRSHLESPIAHEMMFTLSEHLGLQ